ncbi:hypothetical protein XA68_15355 [Ophiocordyceps unilateralis]|uniref:Zona occludens toxin N-terminal domain-containing protein n=1 Tax=Ophiocordyceps unilateralis TaxID=268505 RepID=A0A2A9PMC7_OPHUN|nr:hypothetical protein XA68_15355 [Ophiocordyceps unilateralis]
MADQKLTFTKEPQGNLSELFSHLHLLRPDEEDEGTTYDNEIAASPIFTEAVRRHGQGQKRPLFSQYGLLGGQTNKMEKQNNMFTGSLTTAYKDPRIFHNVSAPSSVFICGSQGSGKSHSLSCLLENCLLPSEAGVLPHPLTGLVLHYDSFVSDAAAASPCEAANLASHSAVQVRVLCPPTNMVNIQSIYSRLPHVKVEQLQIDEQHLNTKRMLDLMAISSIQGGGMPLYLHVVTRILRELRIQQQTSRRAFNYAAFRRALLSQDNMTPGQMAPLQQRLDTLESFMVKRQVVEAAGVGPKQNKATSSLPDKGNSWIPKAGQLTIVDLSCPCVTPDAACALFNICVSLFLEQDNNIGRVIGLDEAHKYMTQSEESASASLTETLLSTIRLQRHLGTRVIISTQEPTVSPKLLDLCSITIVHRFTSPVWLRSLKQHLATDGMLDNENHGSVVDVEDESSQPDLERELLREILALRQGEALLFSPNSIIDVSQREGEGSREKSLGAIQLTKLGSRAIKIRVRKRMTQDGGRTVMAE